ncbi:MAG: tripartite tricarboxylate transporter substrate binding protein [Alphaproteobacteria bacterium]|nr:tripartite tricarboxylate transporter substrate binding protein [Alphaproteobacteria bacterium]
MIRVVTALVAGVVAGLGTFPATAQTWPERGLKIIVPFAAGGPADVYARVLGQHLAGPLGQSILVDNRPGAGSVLGTDAAAKSPADGYTFLMMSNTHTVNETLVPGKPYQLMRDFMPVAPVNYSDLLLVVHPSVPAQSLRELIGLVKTKPGGFNYASSGIGTPYHMAGELFKAMAGVDIVHVPFRGSTGARADVLGGHVHMMFDAITTMASNVQAGSLRGLATSGRERSPVLPNVPTVDEAGVPGYEATIWLGLMAPAGTPAAIVERLNGEVGKIVGRADIRAEWQKQGAQPMVMSTSAFDAYLRADIDKWSKIVRSANIKPE